MSHPLYPDLDVWLKQAKGQVLTKWLYQKSNNQPYQKIAPYERSTYQHLIEAFNAGILDEESLAKSFEDSNPSYLIGALSPIQSKLIQDGILGLLPKGVTIRCIKPPYPADTNYAALFNIKA